MMEMAQEYRTKLLDACADIDEEIMELAREVQLRVRDAFGVAIEPEVNIL